ncbi:MAG: CotH kinase family protein [Acidobacteriota bacterium]|jgi:hypothetical protein
MSDRSLPPRALLTIAIALAVFLFGGSVAERLDYFHGVRDTLQGQAGPAGMPNDGDVGGVLAAALDRYGVGTIFGRLPEALPSSLMVPPERRRGRFPVLSIAADEDYLNDPEIGLMQNMERTGPDWERLATVSLWEGGELVVGSRVGLRIHGDSTRYRGDPSFRLMFRPTYGATSRSGGRLLGADAAPAAAVVVHVVRWRGTYPNIFVFELARRLGLPTVNFRPARVFLNGQPRGIYVLTERVMPDGWGLTHFGDRDFYMYVYKGETKPASRAAHAELEEWVRTNGPLTMAQAAERIDVGNLTRHLVTVMFAFTTDWAQGAALLDTNDPEARWFWLHWDMDQSFDLRGTIEVEPWQQPFLQLVTLAGTRDELEAWGIVTDDRHFARHRDDIRRRLFLQLLRDPEYVRYFVRTITDVLNHELTERYLQELLQRYSALEQAPGGVYSRVDLGDFFRHRPDFVRAEVARAFSLANPVPLRVQTPTPLQLSIDGYPETTPWQGAYYPGQTVTVQAPRGAAVDHWLVDGRRVDGDHVEVAINAPMTIEAVAAGERRVP